MTGQRIIVLVKLRPDTDRAAYEEWARTTDLPTVNALASIDGFAVYEATGLLGGGASPYDYIEVLDIADMDGFGTDVATPTMQRVAAEFQRWANPVFITTRDLSA